MTAEEILSIFQNQDNDSGHPIPTYDAAEYAAILISASAAYRPQPDFINSGNGGFEVRWRKGDKMVRLSVPPNPIEGRPYIAYDEIDYEVKPEKLSHYLSRLNGQE